MVLTHTGPEPHGHPRPEPSLGSLEPGPKMAAPSTALWRGAGVTGSGGRARGSWQRSKVGGHGDRAQSVIEISVLAEQIVLDRLDIHNQCRGRKQLRDARIA